MSSWINNKKKDDAASGGGNNDSSFLNVSDFFGGSGGGLQLGDDDSGLYSADNILDAVEGKPAISFNQNIECISENGTRRMVMMNASGGFYDRRSFEDLQNVSMDESGTSLSVSEFQEEDPSETSNYSDDGDNPSDTSASGHNYEGTQPSSSLPSSSQGMPSEGGSGMVAAAASGSLGTRSAVDRFVNNTTAVEDAQDDVQNATRALNALRSKHAALRDPSIRASSTMTSGQSCPATQAAVAAAK